VDWEGCTTPLDILERCGNHSDGDPGGDFLLEAAQEEADPTVDEAMGMDVSKGLEMGASKAQASPGPGPNHHHA
jgi:hypothetical protein